MNCQACGKEMTIIGCDCLDRFKENKKEVVYSTTVLRHGTHHFKMVGLCCPECKGQEFLNTAPMAMNKYSLKCQTCGCEFAVIYQHGG